MIFIYLILLIFATGSAIILSDLSYFKKLIGLNIIQIATILLYLSITNTYKYNLPYLNSNATEYVTPLPQVLMLTAIVVGFATFALGIALCYKLQKEL